MSMMCCECCGTAIDTDFNVEVCRYGYKVEAIGSSSYTEIISTDNENDTCCICDYCFGDRNEDSWGSWDSEEE